uniref:Uncharacterized protein n=1 Tax=Oryza sativa subsp. japonica TaxID=39947 RepID=Q6ZAH1_ORYSJ|nr:hypothetical protein [Oryza sativa Japonica Group]
MGACVLPPLGQSRGVFAPTAEVPQETSSVGSYAQRRDSLSSLPSIPMRRQEGGGGGG